MTKKSKDELYKDLLRKTEKLGRKPTFIEVRNDQEMADPNDYAYHFRSFSDAIDEVWRVYSFRKTEERVRVAEKTDQNLQKPKKPVACYHLPTDRNKRFTVKEERIDKIREFYINYFVEHEEMPTFMLAEKEIGMTREEMTFMRSKFLLEKVVIAREASKISGKEYGSSCAVHNYRSVLANQERRELEKQFKDTPI